MALTFHDRVLHEMIALDERKRVSDPHWTLRTLMSPGDSGRNAPTWARDEETERERAARQDIATIGG